MGQCELMYIYDKLFTEYNIVAQILITAPDLQEAGSRKRNFHNTLARLLSSARFRSSTKNDTVSTDEIVIGDNDTLSANVASTIGADLLVLLPISTDFATATPTKPVGAADRHRRTARRAHLGALAGGEGSSLGTGGM